MLEFLAEQKIAEAIANGEFDDLPGAGRPLELDDDSLVPDALRLAYRKVRKLGLVRARIEARYYGKVRAKLAPSASSRTRRWPS